MSDSNKQSFWTGTGKMVFQSAISALIFNAFFVVVLFSTKTVEPSTDTYIGLIAGFIAISVTIVIGFQIYNAIDVRSKVSDIDKKSKELERLNDNLIKQSVEAKAMILESTAISYFKEALALDITDSNKIAFYLAGYSFFCVRLKTESEFYILAPNFKKLILYNMFDSILTLLRNGINIDVVYLTLSYNNAKANISSDEHIDDTEKMMNALLYHDITKIADLETIKQKYIP